MEAQPFEKLQLKLGGMSCSFCVASVTKALGRMEGVGEASVNLAHEEALIAYDPTKVTPTQLKDTLLLALRSLNTAHWSLVTGHWSLFTVHSSLTRSLTLGLGGGLLAHLLYGLTDAVALGAKPGVLLWMLL
ncbi:MAG: heavy-metal-associated domain-containing protein, partial [Chloroflexota bacterium]